MSRVVAGLVAILLIGGVTYLGVLSAQDPSVVVWFGIASALLAPVGLTLAGYALAPQNNDLMQRLARVPEIERLVEQARTEEDKLRVLETERARLVEVVQLEARRQALSSRKESLEQDAVRLLDELSALDEEARSAGDAIQESPAREAIQRLHERVKARQAGDVVLRLGWRTYRIDRDVLLGVAPFGSGRAILAYLRLMESYMAKHRREGA